ncbi:protein of unknown function [Cupriavidus taiwanensis]|uniref:Uncharacterized protein n=1 Tax=Cupriavidus taiwanensis TaxID=164546 RepID=A0A7Z7NM28_9BURK|nr:protein of unknown function [Cupriavidus taiwanensis]SPC19020.1 hypothetical protein CBM2594_A80459 [Cupriavidus taiwanensis]
MAVMAVMRGSILLKRRLQPMLTLRSLFGIRRQTPWISRANRRHPIRLPRAACLQCPTPSPPSFPSST